MAEGLLGYQQQSELAQAMQAEHQRRDQAFMGSLLRDQVEGAGEVYMEDGSPRYEPGLMDFTNKDAALNAFIQHRKGRVSDEEILAFNEQFKQMKSMRESKEIDNLNRLSIMGLSDSKVRSFVGNNPQLYGNVVDRILELENMGDEGMASAALLRSKFLPQKTYSQKITESFEESPLGATGAALAIGGGLIGAYRKLAQPWLIEKYGVDQQTLREMGDFTKGHYKKVDGNWVNTQKLTQAGEPKKIGAKTRLGIKLSDFEKGTTPQGRNVLKGMIGSTPGAATRFIGGAVPYFGSTIGRGLGSPLGLEEEGGRVGGLAGGGYLAQRGGKSIYDLLKTAGMRTAKGAAKRHAAAAATGVGANPWVQGLMGLVDLGYGGSEVYKALLGE